MARSVDLDALACAVRILLLQQAKAVASGEVPPLAVVPASGALEPKS